MSNWVSRYRTLIEWMLSAIAITTIVTVMLYVDSPVRQYVGAAGSSFMHDSGGLRIPAPIVHAGRTAWRICMDHQQLAGFAAVAIVLVVFMRRMR